MIPQHISTCYKGSHINLWAGDLYWEGGRGGWRLGRTTIIDLSQIWGKQTESWASFPTSAYQLEAQICHISFSITLPKMVAYLFLSQIYGLTFFQKAIPVDIYICSCILSLFGGQKKLTTIYRQIHVLFLVLNCDFHLLSIQSLGVDYFPLSEPVFPPQPFLAACLGCFPHSKPLNN